MLYICPRDVDQHEIIVSVVGTGTEVLHGSDWQSNREYGEPSLWSYADSNL
jgi:hypothetical protein